MQPAQTSSTYTASVQKPKKRSMRNIKSKRKMANLEKLPVELLEKVYLSCLSVDLPRSSPVIAGKLNSETVYIRTIVAAFGPTWDAYYGKLKYSQGSLEGVGDAKLQVRLQVVIAQILGANLWQSSLLSCRWMSLSLLLKGQDIWVKKNALDRPIEEGGKYTTAEI
jgi:hypothetical protein